MTAPGMVGGPLSWLPEPPRPIHLAPVPRPPFRAYLRCAHGSRVDMIPVLSLGSAGEAEIWHVFAPPGSAVCAPFEPVVEATDEADPNRTVCVRFAIANLHAVGPAFVQPFPMQHTPN